MSTLSVVVITYRRDAFLAECLKSLSKQTLPLQDVVVVDDGGEGSARAVVEQFGAQFRYIWQPNGGQQKARNRGANCATGDWIAYLDDDDLWLPDRHALLAEVIATQEVSLIASDFFKFGENWQAPQTVFDEITEQSRSFWENIEFRSNPKYSVIGSFPLTRLFPVHPFWPSALAIRRDLLDRMNGWNEELRGVKSEDFEFAFRAIKHGQLCIIWQPTVLYRCHPGNDSSSNFLNAIGRATVWETILEDQILDLQDEAVIESALEDTYHEILWSSFSERKYEMFLGTIKKMKKEDLSTKEKFKHLLVKVMSIIT